MENASKALIFAVSVLIAMMIISFAFFLFRRMGKIASTVENRNAGEIEKFNRTVFCL